MLSRSSLGGEEVTYAEVASKLENIGNDEHHDCTFRYCKDRGIAGEVSRVESCCVWKFMVSEGDFKATDVTLGRTFSLQSVDFIIDLIPHKSQ